MDNNNDTLFGLGSDMRLLEFLRTKTTGRFTKLDAFCDLMDRMFHEGHGKKTAERGEDSPYRYGQFSGSITNLAQSWKWHRATVRAFIDELERQGYIRKQEDKNGYIFQLRVHNSASVPVNTIETFQDLGFFLLRHYDDYDLTAEKVATYFEEYYKLMVDNHDEEGMLPLLAEHKAYTILNAFGHLQFTGIFVREMDKAIVRLIASTFEGEDSWSWFKWINALLYLDLALLGEDFPNEHSVDMQYSDKQSVADFSPEDLKLLRELFYYVKRFDGSSPVKPNEQDGSHKS